MYTKHTDLWAVKFLTKSGLANSHNILSPTDLQAPKSLKELQEPNGRQIILILNRQWGDSVCKHQDKKERKSSQKHFTEVKDVMKINFLA